MVVLAVLTCLQRTQRIQFCWKRLTAGIWGIIELMLHFQEVLMARLIAVIVTVLAIFGYFFVYPNFLRARTGGRFVHCCSNLKNIGMALEEYAKQHNGRYPDVLLRLTPAYLREIPKCHAGTHGVYEYVHSSKPEAYTVYCPGDYHRPVCQYNGPRYDSIQGLDDR
jgi:hypothetical protein